MKMTQAEMDALIAEMLKRTKPQQPDDDGLLISWTVLVPMLAAIWTALIVIATRWLSVCH
jgi:hypothetical protein